MPPVQFTHVNEPANAKSVMGCATSNEKSNPYGPVAADSRPGTANTHEAGLGSKRGSARGSRRGRRSRQKDETAVLHAKLDDGKDSSDGDAREEPSEFTRKGGMKFRVWKASVFNDINDDPNQFTAPDEMPSAKSMAKLEKGVQQWMAAVALVGLQDPQAPVELDVERDGADSLGSMRSIQSGKNRAARRGDRPVKSPGDSMSDEFWSRSPETPLDGEHSEGSTLGVGAFRGMMMSPLPRTHSRQAPDDGDDFYLSAGFVASAEGQQLQFGPPSAARSLESSCNPGAGPLSPPAEDAVRKSKAPTPGDDDEQPPTEEHPFAVTVTEAA